MFTTNDWIVLITILAYMAIMIAIGFAVSKKNKTSSDFFLGGRQLGPLVTAMSAEASDMSGWLLMGMPGLALTATASTPSPFPISLPAVSATVKRC